MVGREMLKNLNRRRFGGFAAQKDTYKATKGSTFCSMGRKKTPPVGGCDCETVVS